MSKKNTNFVADLCPLRATHFFKHEKILKQQLIMKKIFTLLALCLLSLGMMAEKQISGVIRAERPNAILHL